MGTLSINIRWLPHGTGLSPPQQQSNGAAGVDLAAALAPDEPLCLEPGKRALVPTGFCMALPNGFEAQIRPRSGLALKHGISVLNAPGTVDADYRGEISVLLVNHGDRVFSIKRGDRIAQMVVARVSQVIFQPVSELDQTERGEKGYGSTGYTTS